MILHATSRYSIINRALNKFCHRWPRTRARASIIRNLIHSCIFMQNIHPCCARDFSGSLYLYFNFTQKNNCKSSFFISDFRFFSRYVTHDSRFSMIRDFFLACPAPRTVLLACATQGRVHRRARRICANAPEKARISCNSETRRIGRLLECNSARPTFGNNSDAVTAAGCCPFCVGCESRSSVYE